MHDLQGLHAYLLTYSSLTTYLLTDWLTDSLTYLLTDLLTYSPLTYHLLTYSLTG